MPMLGYTLTRYVQKWFLHFFNAPFKVVLTLVYGRNERAHGSNASLRQGPTKPPAHQWGHVTALIINPQYLVDTTILSPK